MADCCYLYGHTYLAASYRTGLGNRFNKRVSNLVIYYIITRSIHRLLCHIVPKNPQSFAIKETDLLEFTLTTAVSTLSGSTTLQIPKLVYSISRTRYSPKEVVKCRTSHAKPVLMPHAMSFLTPRFTCSPFHY